MKFLTPAFVRVKNPLERKELSDWMLRIGYNGVYCMICSEAEVLVGNILRMPKNAVDCGTNIPLFKALAAMNDENYREQYYIGAECQLWQLCDAEKWERRGILPFGYRKATAQEIINYFQSRYQTQTRLKTCAHSVFLTLLCQAYAWPYLSNN